MTGATGLTLTYTVCAEADKLTPIVKKPNTNNTDKSFFIIFIFRLTILSQNGLIPAYA
jgi:hypothetical protein